MSDQFTGEIRIFGGNFAPQDWAFCDGSLLAIATYPQLFNVLGTTYGGDGEVTFALPDLRGRIPLHVGTDRGGNNYAQGQAAGSEQITLTTQQMPQHSHAPAGASIGGSSNPSGNTFASGPPIYSSAAPSVSMSPSTVQNQGGSQPHNNLMPYLCISFIIALNGVTPSAS